MSNNPNPVTPSDGWSDDQGTIVSNTDVNGELIGPQADSDWLNVVPTGIYDLLIWLNKRYNKPMFLITENGVDVPGESEMSLEQALKDTFRIDYYSSYLDNVMKAITSGVNVGGYFAWSLVDNFEWNNGYSCRFGLNYIDYTNNLTRIPKDSSKWYSNFTKYNRK